MSGDAYALGWGLGLAVVVLLLLWLAKRQHSLRLYANQQRGIAWLQALRTLLSHIQQHRGLTTGFLGGDGSLKHKIEALQIEISRDVSAIAAIGSWMEDNENWRGITQHWARLAASYKNAELENNLTQHNKLITNMLYLVEDTAEAHHLSYLVADAASSVSLIWRELLVAAECIGQVRALGTGGAAAGECSSVARIRLNYLRNKIERLVNETWRNLSIGGGDRERLVELLRCIDEEILGPEPRISANDYFSKATLAMEGLFDQFDRELAKLKFLLR